MLNLGTLQFSLAIDTRALSAARNRIEAFGNAVSQVQRQANRGLDTNIAAFRKQENAILAGMERLKAATNAISNAKISPQLKTELIEQAGRMFNDLTKNIGQLGNNVDSTKFDRAVASYRSGIADLNRTLQNAPKDSAADARAKKLIEEARNAEKAAASYRDFDRAVRSVPTGKSAASSASVFKDAFKVEDANNAIRAAQTAIAAQARYNEILGITSKNASSSARASAEVFMNAAKGADAAEKAVLRQANAYAKAEERVRNLNAQIERSKLNLDSKTSLTVGPDTALQRLQSTINVGKPLNTKEFSGAMNAFNKELGDSNRLFQATVAKSNNMTASMEKLRDGLRGVGSGFLLINGHLGGMSTRMIALSQISGVAGIKIGLLAAAATGFGLAASSMVSGAIQASMAIEKSSKAMEAIYGNTVDAANGLKFVRQVSDQAGLSFAETAQSYTRYVAAAKAANQSNTETERQFRVLSLASGKLNLGVEDTQGVFRALEQIMSKGKVQAEELRGQLGDRLPGAFNIAATAMGVTTAQLNKMMKDGEVVSKEFVPKFISALQKAYNIDLGKPVDTTQAAINRLTTATTLMFNAFDKATGTTKLYTGILKGLAEAADFATNHMQSLVTAAAGIAGALTGAAAGFVAIQVALAAFAILPTVLAWIGSFASLALGAKTATELWALAQTALNVSMMSNPIGAFLGLVARLAVVIGGAYLGYKLFTDAVQGSNSALADTSAIDGWIVAQQKLRTATDETVKSMIKQQLVQQAQAKSNLDAARNELRSAREDRFNQLHPKTIFGGDASKSVTPVARMLIDRQTLPKITEATNKVKEATAATQAQTRAVTGLVGVLNTPIADGQGSVLDATTDGSGNASKRQANIDSIYALIDAYTAAKDKLSELAKLGGKDDILKVDDLLKAKDTLRGMSKEEIGLSTSALQKAGLFVTDLTTSLKDMNTAIRISEEQSAAFIKVWQDLDRDSIELNGLKKAIDFLKGGGDPEQLFLVKAATDAEVALRKLDGEHLERIRQRLASMGVEGKTAAEALTKFFSQGDAGSKLVQTLSDVAEAQRKANDRIKEAAMLSEAYAKSAWVGEAMEKVIANTRIIEEFQRQLNVAVAAGAMSQDEATAAVQRLYDALANADKAEEGLERIKQRSLELKASLTDMTKSFSSGIIEVIKGTQSLGKMIKETLLNFVFKNTENALNNVFGDLLDGIFNKKKATSQAESIKNNVQALNKNTDALMALITQLGGVANIGAGGGGGGLIGTIANLLGSAVGGKSDGGKTGSFISGAINAIGSLFGRASGGPVTAGKAYRVTEQGAGSEIFFPGTSGTIVPTSKMGGGHTIHYDGRTTIDARGATQETIEQLRLWASERETRLRAELPLIIDSRVTDSTMRGRY